MTKPNINEKNELIDGIIIDKQQKLVKKISLLGAIIIGPFSVIYLSMGNLFIGFSSIFFALIYVLCYLIARKGFLLTARVVMLFFSILLITSMGFGLGEKSGQITSLFPLLVGIFVLFRLDERKWIFILSALGAFCTLWLELSDYKLFGYVINSGMTPEMLHYSRIGNFATSIIAIIFCMYYLKRGNDDAERKLAQEQNNIRSIIENTPDFIWLVNKDGFIVTLNQNFINFFQAYYGIALKEGMNVYDSFDTDNQDLKAELSKWSDHYTRVFAGEQFSIHMGGEDERSANFYVEISFNPILNEQEVTGAAIFLRNVSESRLLERQLKDNTYLQSSIINGTEDIIFTIGPDSIITSLNKSAEKLLGYRADEILNLQTPAIFIEMESVKEKAKRFSTELGIDIPANNFISTYMSALNDEAYKDEWIFVTKSGKRLFVNTTVTSLKSENNKTSGYLIISTDITQRKADEEKLRLAAEEDKKRIWVSAGLGEINDIFRSVDFNSAEKLEQTFAFLARYCGALQGALYVTEHLIKGKDRLIPAAILASDRTLNKLEYMEWGEGLIGQVAQEKKEIILHGLSAEKFRISSGLIDTQAAQVYIFPLMFNNDIKGVAELATLEQFSDTQLDFLRKTSEIMAANIDLNARKVATEKLLKEAQELNERLQTQEEELRASNEELILKSNMLSASEEELRQQQEELMQANSHMEEKTQQLEEQNESIRTKNEELEHAREAIRLKADELELSSRYKSEFLANMSHELRTPLNSILILAKLLAESKDSPLSEKQKEFTKVITRSGNDLLNLINDILDLSKIESRKIDLEIENIAFKDIAYDIETQFRELAIEKGINYQIELSDKLNPDFSTDKTRVEQVLKNLLSNSFKFTDKAGNISLRIYPAPEGMELKNPGLINKAGNVCFEVRDTGIGIPFEKQEYIFQAFRQVDGSTSRKYGGTGLGLSICRELAIILGGEIKLSSTPGQGSTFTFILPAQFNEEFNDLIHVAKQDRDIVASPNPLKTDKAKPASPHKREKRKQKLILIIEDDKSFANLLLKQVQDRGLDGVIAMRGDTGLQKAIELRPDAILLDVGLPVMDGWELMKKLKADPELAGIPVHIMTGNDNKQLGMELGAADFLTKPITTQALSQTLSQIELSVVDNNKVLVIEDNKDQNNAVKSLLGAYNLECEGALTGKEALVKLKSGQFRLIVLDLSLPDIDGGQLLQEIRKNPAWDPIKIIIFTGKLLSNEEHNKLSKYSNAIIVKTDNSYERLLDEANLFFRKIEKADQDPSSFDSEQDMRVWQDALKGKKILLVDDDMRNVFALSQTLENIEMEVVIANDGQEALDKINTVKGIDLVLMDIMMPGMDGYEATRHIRSMPMFSKIPIIALTAKAMKGDREKCIEAGASDYISKPVDISKLMSLMRVWLTQ